MSNANGNSILHGSLVEVFKCFSGKECDEIDLLAQRALSIIFATSHLVQPGCDIKSAPVRANMIASAVLVSISEEDKHYPFVRDTLPANAWAGSLSDDDLDFLFHQAKNDLGIAEALIPEGLMPEPVLFTSDHHAPLPMSGNFSGLVSIAEVEPLVFEVSILNGAPAVQ